MILEDIYPVGSIYINYSSSTSPATKLGFGTWTRIYGKYIYAAEESKTPEETGGSDKITTSMMPQHKHSVNITSTGAGAHTHTIKVYGYYRGGNDDGRQPVRANNINDWPGGVQTNWTVSDPGDHTHDISGDTGNAGTAASSQSKNLPTYQSFYMWRRTA